MVRHQVSIDSETKELLDKIIAKVKHEQGIKLSPHGAIKYAATKEVKNIPRGA